MTKQKIVIRLSMASEKTRSRAMALVAKADGVSSMGVTGDGRDQLEVVGDGVCLVQCLRRKIGPAEILKVEEVKPAEKKPEEKKPEQKMKKFDSPRTLE
ncbi:unnamed protein product [Urochloa humidicola]